jgi:sugar phosphate isomerase/epimerase
MDTPSFTIAGKCEPDKEAFSNLYESGFTNFELYLNTTILDSLSVDEIVSECTSAPGNVVAVHTPHFNIQENGKKYLQVTDTIAAELEAAVIFDSNPTSTRYIPSVYPTSDISASVYGYENDPSISKFYLETYHLGNELPLVLDTAHLHMSERTYIPFIEQVLSVYQDLIPVVHLAEATRVNDGLPYGSGSVELQRIVEILDTYNYSGIVTIETSQETQPEGLQFVKDVLDL